MKRTTVELYGVGPSEFWDLPYGEALARKKELAKQRLREVSEEISGLIASGRGRMRDERLPSLLYLQKDIYDAVAFNEALLDEKDGKEAFSFS